jgi:hypothetical protein
MRALTLTQPYATLIAIEEKHIETRSWHTSYRGPLAIHAAKGYPMSARDLAARDPFYTVLRASMSVLPTTGEPPVLPGLLLPLGAIVATCELIDIVSTNQLPAGWRRGSHAWWFTEQEQAFGDYSPNRYAWLLANVRALATPIAATGQLGLWEYKGALE